MPEPTYRNAAAETRNTMTFSRAHKYRINSSSSGSNSFYGSEPEIYPKRSTKMKRSKRGPRRRNQHRSAPPSSDPPTPASSKNGHIANNYVYDKRRPVVGIDSDLVTHLEQSGSYTGPSIEDLNRHDDDQHNQGFELAVMGELLCTRGHYTEAIPLFLKALAMLGLGHVVSRDLTINDPLDVDCHVAMVGEVVFGRHGNTVSDGESVGDARTLSAVFSQLGNAYHYTRSYGLALACHAQDLKYTMNSRDMAGEAKAWGNLSNSYKMMGYYDEAICCSEHHYHIARLLKDQVSESKAAYNLGSVYHGKAKFLEEKKRTRSAVGVKNSHELPIPEDPSLSAASNENMAGGGIDDNFSCRPTDYKRDPLICETLQRALEYYEEALRYAKNMDEENSVGRIFGNLGNVHYLLGNFERAIYYHKQRLSMACYAQDLYAQRRANTNLANAHIFLGEFQDAIEYYTQALRLSLTMGDLAFEAQTYYSLGNTYALFADFSNALDNHMAHLELSKSLQDDPAQLRSYWSLSHIYLQQGDLESALKYGAMHYDLARKMEDVLAQRNAQQNLDQIHKFLANPASNPSYNNLSMGLFSNFSALSLGPQPLNQCNSNNQPQRHSTALTAAANRAEDYEDQGGFEARKVGSQYTKAVGGLAAPSQSTPLSTAVSNRKAATATIKNGSSSASSSMSLSRKNPPPPSLSTNTGNNMARTGYPISHSSSITRSPDSPVWLRAYGQGLPTPTPQLPPVTPGHQPDTLSQISSIYFHTTQPGLPHKRRSMENMDQLLVMSPLSSANDSGSTELPKISSDPLKSNDDQSKNVNKGQANDHDFMSPLLPKHTKPVVVKKSQSLQQTEAKTDEFYDLVTSFQSHRMDDQRSDISIMTSHMPSLPSLPNIATKMRPRTIHFSSFSLGKRFSLKKKNSYVGKIDWKKGAKKNSGTVPLSQTTQRSTLPSYSAETRGKSSVPGDNLLHSIKNQPLLCHTKNPEDEDFFDIVFRAQSSRIDDQRVAAPTIYTPQIGEDEIIDLVCKMQSGRIDEQRSVMINK